VNQPKNDPFFEELKADIQEALDEVRRGETVDEDEVWKTVYATIERVKRRREVERTRRH
jgi:hypothetical protein